MARPTVNGGRKRKNQKIVFFSDAEVRKIEKRMRENGESGFSAFARRLLTEASKNKKVKVEYEAPREVLRELGAIGNNINQIARNSNLHDAATRNEIYEAVELIRRLARILDPITTALSEQYTHCPTCKQKLSDT